MDTKVGIGWDLKFSQSLVMLLIYLLDRRACINKKTKDTVSKTPIDDSVKVWPSSYFCWVRSLKEKSESLSGFLIHAYNKGLAVVTIPNSIVLSLINFACTHKT